MAWVKEARRLVSAKKTGYAPLTQKQQRRMAELRRQAEAQSPEKSASNCDTGQHCHP
jgi:hypothetical protein